MIRTIALLLLSVLLVLPQPSAALDLQGLYEQALTASRRGDFADALPLWDQVLHNNSDSVHILATDPPNSKIPVHQGGVVCTSQVILV